MQRRAGTAHLLCTTLLGTVLALPALPLAAQSLAQKKSGASQKKAAAPQKEAEAALTNGDVLDLVKAGLPESVVLTKVRTAPVEKLDISAKALIALKEGGASGAVIEAVMARAGNPPQRPADPAAAGGLVTLAPSGGGAGAAAPGAAAGAPTAETGIYWVREANGKEDATRVEASAYIGKTTGFAGKTATAWVESDKAALALAEGQPLFRFRFSPDGSAGNLPGSGPEEFVLAPMKLKDGKRSLVIGKLGSFGAARAGVDPDDAIQLETKKLSPGVFTVRPKAPLKPGEYCFFRAPANSMDVFLGGGGKVWTFGVSGPVVAGDGGK